MGRSNLVETVLAACRADALVSHGGPIVVAVSGGPDSTALLHALTRAEPRLGLRLTAAHFDHRARRRSAGDAAAVAEMCAALGVPLVTGRAQAGGARSEDGLRRARYGFLEEAAAAVGAPTLALGHTADDQAETVLLHLLRGSGLEGLAAMPVREGLRFRPLLGAWREDVETYCRRQHLDPLEDASNRSRRYTRNRVRHDLLPRLAAYNPRVKWSLVRLADAARDEHAVVAQLAEAWLARQAGTYSRRSLAEQPVAVQVEVVRRAWGAAGDGDEVRGDAARLRQAVHLIAASTRSTGMLDLGRGLQLSVARGRFRFIQNHQ